MSVDVNSGPLCGCFGCPHPGRFVIQHDTHGRRVVCLKHAEDEEVVDHG